MAEPDIDIVELFFGEHGLAYEDSATLGERVWALAETVRRRFEESGCVVRGENPALPEKAKQIVEQREREKRSFFSAGGVLGKIGHDVSPVSSTLIER